MRTELPRQDAGDESPPPSPRDRSLALSDEHSRRDGEHDERAGLAFVRRQNDDLRHRFSIISDRTIAETWRRRLHRICRHARSSIPSLVVVTWTATITRNLAIDALRLRRALPSPDDVLWTEW